jgi:hypothetical protein
LLKQGRVQRLGHGAVAVLLNVKPELLTNIETIADVFCCCSSVFGQPKLQMISEEKVGAAFCLPLLHKAPC